MKKEKIETIEELQKRKAKEAKEIAKLEKEKAKPKYLNYLFWFLFIISIAYLVDEVTSNVGKFMGTVIADHFFANGGGNKDALKLAADVCVYLTAAAAFVLRPLADRYGRKLFLVIYTLGMGVGMLAISVATEGSIPGWAIGAIIIQFCTPQDVHAVYIQESVPQAKRGTYFSISKGIATIGMMLVPLFRYVFGVGEALDDKWRNVYFALAMVGVFAALLCALFLRESDIFIDTRLAYLKKTDEERAKDKEATAVAEAKFGLLQGFKHLFKSKQLLWIGISFGFVFMAYQLTSGYDSITKYFWGLQNNPTNGVFDVKMFDSQAAEYIESFAVAGDKFVTQMLFLYPVGCAVIEFLPGIIADKIGRKKATFFFAAGSIIFYALFYVSARFVWSPYLTGLFIGAACGSVWSYGDLLLLMSSESTETPLRVSVNTATYIFSGVFYGAEMGIFSAITLITGDASIAPVTLVITMIGLAIGTFFLLTKVKDTKDVDIYTVKASDFE